MARPWASGHASLRRRERPSARRHGSGLRRRHGRRHQLVDGPISKSGLILPCMALLVGSPSGSIHHRASQQLYPAFSQRLPARRLPPVGSRHQAVGSRGSCPTSSPTPGGFWLYSMKVVASYKKTSTGPPLQEVIGSDVVDGEVVSFPSEVALDTIVTLDTTIRRQHCISFAYGNQCGQVEKMSGPSYKAILSARGAFCRARGTGVVALDDDPATPTIVRIRSRSSRHPHSVFVLHVRGRGLRGHQRRASRPQLKPFT